MESHATNTIMQDIPAPPSLLLPQISFSAPQSRVASRPPTPRRRTSVSQPTSPLAKKKPRSPIGKKLVPKSPTRSPAHALRKHRYHATFSQHDVLKYERSQSKTSCPVHSYSDAQQEIKMMPDRALSKTAVKWGDTPRDVPMRSNCPVHVYADAKSMLKETHATFAKHDERAAVPDVCPVHAYSEPKSTLKGTPATFARFSTPRSAAAAGSGPDVHAYSEPRSTLRAHGAIPFGGAETRGRRGAFQGVERSLAPVHAYAEPTSSLRRTGGTMAMSSRSGWLHTLSRTGLVPAAGTAPVKPRTLKPLPSKLAVSSAVEEEGSGSPREVEAQLGMEAVAAGA